MKNRVRRFLTGAMTAALLFGQTPAAVFAAEGSTEAATEAALAQEEALPEQKEEAEEKAAVEETTANVSFKLKNADGQELFLGTADVYDSDYNWIGSVDFAGDSSLELDAPGSYRIVMSSIPEGYDNPEEISFKVTEDSVITVEGEEKSAVSVVLTRSYTEPAAPETETPAAEEIAVPDEIPQDIPAAEPEAETEAEATVPTVPGFDGTVFVEETESVPTAEEPESFDMPEFITDDEAVPGEDAESETESETEAVFEEESEEESDIAATGEEENVAAISVDFTLIGEEEKADSEEAFYVKVVRAETGDIFKIEKLAVNDSIDIPVTFPEETVEFLLEEVMDEKGTPIDDTFGYTVEYVPAEAKVSLKDGSKEVVKITNTKKAELKDINLSFKVVDKDGNELITKDKTFKFTLFENDGDTQKPVTSVDLEMKKAVWGKVLYEGMKTDSSFTIGMDDDEKMILSGETGKVDGKPVVLTVKPEDLKGGTEGEMILQFTEDIPEGYEKSVKDGKITIKKNVKMGDVVLTPTDSTYKFQVYKVEGSKEEKEGEPIEIQINGGNTDAYKWVTGYATGYEYIVKEIADDGTEIEIGGSGMIDEAKATLKSAEGSSVKLTNENKEGTFTLTNSFAPENVPKNYTADAKITVKKHVLDASDQKIDDKKNTFYYVIKKNDEETPLIGPKALEKNGWIENSIKYYPGRDDTYYVYETNEKGEIFKEGSNVGSSNEYTVSYKNSSFKLVNDINDVTTEITNKQTATYKAPTIVIRKVNSAGYDIVGAGLTISTEEGKSLLNWTTDGNQKSLNVTAPGTYYLKETSVPVGYLAASPIKIEVTATGGVKVNDAEVSDFTIKMLDKVNSSGGYYITPSGSVSYGTSTTATGTTDATAAAGTTLNGNAMAGNAKTGDESPIGLYIGLAVAALALIGAVVVIRKRR